MHICVYICIHICVHALCYMCVHTYIEGDRETETEKFIREASNILPYSDSYLTLRNVITVT